MPKTILVTGSSDCIGLQTARLLVARGHHVLMHGRSPAKLAAAAKTIDVQSLEGTVESHVADLSRMADVDAFAAAIRDKHDRLDVLINNAGIFVTSRPRTPDGLDVRFAVNTLAPYLLTRRLLPLMRSSGRVVNLSSAAQSAVNPGALAGRGSLDDGAAYAQSKLALTMWSRSLGLSLKDSGPAVIAVNPGSMLGSKMVKRAYGVAGGDIAVGAKILLRAALDDDFSGASGEYFDNDSGRFASPHADALNPQKVDEIVRGIEAILRETIGTGVA